MVRGYTVVTPNKWEVLRENLYQGKGKLLTFRRKSYMNEPLCIFTENGELEIPEVKGAIFELFDCPRLDWQEVDTFISVDNKKPHNRKYVLEQKWPKMRIPETLDLGSHVFYIERMIASGTGIDIRGNTLYISREEGMWGAFQYALSAMVPRINEHCQSNLGPQDIEKIISYALQDLKTGEVLKRNRDYLGNIFD